MTTAAKVIAALQGTQTFQTLLCEVIYVGIDEHGLKFLDHVYKSGDFGKTITIGRQSINIPVARSRVLKILSDAEFCEDLLTQHFGSNSVDSIDHSPYEGANIIHDLNFLGSDF